MNPLSWLLGAVLLAGCGKGGEPVSVDGDHDGSPAGEDCDDDNPARYPGASDGLCDGVDHDCDGVLAVDWYVDADGDGYGSGHAAECSETALAGRAANASDCDDSDGAVHPDAADDACDGIDHDCDGLLPQEWYQDLDGDTYGDSAAVRCADTRPHGFAATAGDCDDADPYVHPGSMEVCDGQDDDCDGAADEDFDGDGDGYACGADCDDYATWVHPGATEVCDDYDVDEDCDGLADDEDPDVAPASEATWYEDADGDGAGGASSWTGCDPPSGYTTRFSGDCDDSNSDVGPHGVELCGNGVDDDCDGGVDDEGCLACDIVVPDDEPTIQGAIDAAATGDTVCVDKGTYIENIDFHGAEITVRGIYGQGATLIDGGSADTVVRFESGETAASVLRGFTLSGGKTTGSGGGILVDGASPTIVDVGVYDNEAADDGGGVAIYDGDPDIDGLRVAKNMATDGGGLYISGGSPTLRRVRVYLNTAYRGSGGGLYVTGGSAASLTNLDVFGNSSYGPSCATCAGGGLYVGGAAAPVVHSAAVSDNYALGDEEIEIDDADPVLVGVLVDAGSDGIDVTSGTASLSYVDVWAPRGTTYVGVADPTGADGNLEVDPATIDVAGHLDATSPLVDAGDPSVFDPDGSISDIGVWSGAEAATWDNDGDGYPDWWLPGPYDPLTSPGADCDDGDATVYPGHGC